MFTVSSIHNYAKSGMRAITRHKLSLLVSVMGLSVAIATILLMAVYTIHELSYDKEHPNADRTYRVMEMVVDSGRKYSMTSPHGFQHYKKIPGVEDYVGLIKGDWLIETNVQANGGYIQLQGVYAATEHVLDFFKIQVVSGSIKKALEEPDKIALSESEAIRFFGKPDVVDQVLITGKQTWTVVAVFKDLPANTHLDIKALIASRPFEGNMGKLAYTYIRVSANADIGQISTAITQVMADIWQATGVDFYLQPLLAIHLDSNLKEEMKTGGSHLVVTLALILCTLLVFIVGFSSIYMGLARIFARGKDAGIQQYIGASKRRLIAQCIIASVVLYIVSGILACVIAYLYLGEFNLLVSRTLELNFTDIITVAIFCILLGVLSGRYIAFYISTFNPNRVLSGDLHQSKTAIALRRIVLVLQSAISIGFVIAAFSFFCQLGFLKNLSTHYERTNRLQVIDISPGKLFFHESFAFGGHHDMALPELERIVRESSDSLAREIKNIDGVISATPTDFDLTRQLSAGVRRFTIQGMEAFPQVFGYGGVGYNAAAVLGLDLIAGRDFIRETDLFNSQDNTLSIFIPESMVSQAGFADAEAAIGKTAQFAAGPFDNINATIIGVFKDITLGSIKEDSFPMIFGGGLSWAQSANLVFQVDKDNQKVREEITTLLGNRLQLYPPVIESVAQNYDLIYQQDHKMARLIFTLSGIAVMLSVISLVGLSALAVSQRNKEIADRKAQGSSRLNVLWLLAKEQLLMTVIGLVLVSPIAFWLIEKWLENYNARIEQTIFVYLAAGLLIAAVTIIANYFIVSRVMKVKQEVVPGG